MTTVSRFVAGAFLAAAAATGIVLAGAGPAAADSVRITGAESTDSVRITGTESTDSVRITVAQP